MIQRLVSALAAVLGFVNRKPGSVVIRRRLWGWDLAISWPDDAEDEPVGFGAPAAVVEDDEEGD